MSGAGAQPQVDDEGHAPGVPDPKGMVSMDTTMLASEAKHAADAEQQMSLGTAMKLYPKAIGWSVLLSSTLIMEGYDLALLSSLYASPPFNKKYGTYDAKSGKYALSAAWQSGLSNGARAGEIIGLILAGWTADRFGYKMTTMLNLGLMILFIFVLFFAPNVQVLVVGEVLCGKLSPRALPVLNNDAMNVDAWSQHQMIRDTVGRFPVCHTGLRLGSRSRGATPLPNDIH